MNLSRHAPVFSSLRFADRRIDVIGVGATGSHVAVSLAKLGLKNIHVHDHDKVEAHNIPNQTYCLADIGKLKVKALQAEIKRLTGTVVTAHPERVTGATRLGEYVFLLTDSMESRREIWEGAIRHKLAVKLMIETRIGTDQGRIYTLNPCDPIHAEEWEATLKNVPQSQRSACGASVTVGPTAQIVANWAVWQFMRYVNTTLLAATPEDNVQNEVIIGIKSGLCMARTF